MGNRFWEMWFGVQDQVHRLGFVKAGDLGDMLGSA